MPNRPAIFRPKGPKKVARPSYDARRGSAHRRGYTRSWSEYSTWFRTQHPFCCKCEEGGNLVAAECVDHIIAVSGPNDPLFWEESNHAVLCHMHHSMKTAKEDGGFGHRRKES